MLHIACLYGNVRIIEFLINKGCDKNQKNKLGERPYDIVKDLCHEEARVYLKRIGAKETKRGVRRGCLIC